MLTDPLLLPITNHTRTSVSTATVRQIDCKNFPDNNQVTIAYYDGERCLGKFLLGQEHNLTTLKGSTREITARATDDAGNAAERSFTVDQHSPMYISVVYKPLKRKFKSLAVVEQQSEQNTLNNNRDETKVQELHDSKSKVDEHALKEETSVGAAFKDIL